jgi:hypothetical protein
MQEDLSVYKELDLPPGYIDVDFINLGLPVYSNSQSSEV